MMQERTSGEFWVQNEWAPLKKVMVGIGVGVEPAPSPEDTYDPKSREHVLAGTYPTEAAVRAELTGFRELLTRLGVEVLTPPPLGTNQVFTRDIGFVLEDRFVVTSMVSDRAEEQKALRDILAGMPEDKIIQAPEHVRVEGGDVLPMDGELWVGYSEEPDFSNFVTARTNRAGLDWLQATFPNWKVRGFQLTKSDTDPRRNALHLDCALGVFGGQHALVHPEGFKVESELAYVLDQFPPNHVLKVSAEEMYDMNCNLFSISPNTVISAASFHRINAQLEAWGYTVHKVPFAETAKMEGLLRCSTLPLLRGHC